MLAARCPLHMDNAMRTHVASQSGVRSRIRAKCFWFSRYSCFLRHPVRSSVVLDKVPPPENDKCPLNTVIRVRRCTSLHTRTSNPESRRPSNAVRASMLKKHSTRQLAHAPA